jgi:hypothetical protein
VPGSGFSVSSLIIIAVDGKLDGSEIKLGVLKIEERNGGALLSCSLNCFIIKQHLLIGFYNPGYRTKQGT